MKSLSSYAGKSSWPEDFLCSLKQAVDSCCCDSMSVFSWRSVLRERRRWQMPVVSCSYCSETFISRQARRKHFSVHQEERQFKRRRSAFSIPSFLANDNGDLLVSSANIQPDNLGGVTRQNRPLNLNDSPPSLVNVGNDAANNLADVNSRLIVPSPFGGGFQFSLLTASKGIFSLGSVNPLQNFMCPNLWNDVPNVGDGEDAEITNVPSNWLGLCSPQLARPEEQPKKELILFEDVTGVVVSPE